MLFEAGFFLVPLITAAVYREIEIWCFAVSILICIGAAGLMFVGKPKSRSLYAREGFVIVSLSWIFLSMFGAIPLVLSGVVPSYIDALFETVSGFTTTGATIFQSVEELPRSILVWRSFTHWVGGMGVLVFVMAILPSESGRSIHIMRAEMPGPIVGKLVPKAKQTAKILYLIYIVMTFILTALLLFGINFLTAQIFCNA